MHAHRYQLIRTALANRILVLDGAMGTALQGYDLGPDDFGAPAFEGCNEQLNRTRPEIVREIHRAYYDAGADIIETNTFGATAVVLREYDLEADAYELNLAAARLAVELRAEYETPERPRFVAGCMGPTSKSLCVTGGVSFDELRRAFCEQALGLIDGGVDYLLLETMQDTLNVKAGFLGIGDACQQRDCDIPTALSVTIEPMGTMLAGQSIEALYTSVRHFRPLYVGLNCATGPEFMTDHLRTLASMAECGISCVPNAGLPDESGNYLQTADDLAGRVERFMESGWISLVGGCCGTRPAHIAALAERVGRYRPYSPCERAAPALSGVDYLPVQQGELYLIGERTNVIGSRRFKRLITEGDLDEAVEVARRQVRSGAHVIDVCLANPDRDEYEDMRDFLDVLVRSVRVPLMIDSTDADVVEMSLKRIQGKAIINSINLEQGRERFDQIVPLARTYGAMLVVGTIDEDPEQGMALSAERKLAIARRSYELLVGEYGMEPEDIIFDPLVFPVATGDAQYRTSAMETIEGLKLIRDAFPRTQLTIGLSNVSFGLPPAAREILNSVFLHHCTLAGLNFPIINTELMVRYSSIAAEDLELCEDLIFARTEDPITPFAARYRDVKQREARSHLADLPAIERLERNIVEGTRELLQTSLDEVLAERSPLEIINGPLMNGMAEVGRLFNDNQLIVAEVLQSAEVMKSAVDYLSGFMDKADIPEMGTMVLATVKGDVHDIGKNLVDIIMSNNGFRVINLGIKIPSEQIIAAIREHRPDFVGLSGLLVRSAQQMIATAADIRAAGIDVPIFVGGAALSENFAFRRIQPEYEGAVMYARDPMELFGIARRLVDPVQGADVLREVRERQQVNRDQQAAQAPRPAAPRPEKPVVLEHIPAPPDLQLHRHEPDDLESVFEYVNPSMLYAKHLGYRGFEAALAAEEPKALDLQRRMRELVAELQRDPAVRPAALWQFFRCHRDGDESVCIQRPDGSALRSLRLPRTDKGRSLADYVHPEADFMAIMCVTAGSRLNELATQARHQGDYLRSHSIASLALELSEALAEILHLRLRSMWGISSEATLSKRDLFAARYRGRRYAPGYPAIPDMELQRDIFALIEPEQIGVQLTEGLMMEPEASTSALVLHHPEALYF